ncbi:MAG TPA: response regulator transcription factor, partial [Polyangiaceae bacterium]|nr:response regulator transcription factor [Polyangiaceae bacterium]
MSRVLLVEDEPAILESLAFVLERDGFTPHPTSSLSSALERLQSETFELVVLDLMLPDGSGFDLIRTLRASGRGEPALIVLSSRDHEQDRVRALEMGADDYVTKPFSPREMVARARAVLRRTRQGAPQEV